MDKPGQKVVSCPKCKRYYRLPPQAALKPGARLRCTKCGELFNLEPRTPAVPDRAAAPEEPTAPGTPSAAEAPASTEEPAENRIIVATDGSEMWGIIEEVLAAAGFAARLAGSGEEALGAILEWKPAAAVLDVSLPGTPVFEVCDRIRKDGEVAGMGIILLASVYEQTRYKRAPTSLYGADDYIEKHHLRDSLVPKVERLRKKKEKSAVAAVPSPGEREEARPYKEGVVDPQQARREHDVIVREERFGPAEAPPPSQSESLRRFARIIVSDIALYNQEVIETGVRDGNLRELLAEDAAEGKKLFRTRAPDDADLQIYEEALAEFLKQQQARFKAPGGP